MITNVKIKFAKIIKKEKILEKNKKNKKILDKNIKKEYNDKKIKKGMKLMIDDEFSKTIVEGLQLGLKRAKLAERENGDIFDNAKRLRNIDKMMSSLYSIISLDARYEAKEFYRGSYKLLFVYNREEHRLYSFMSEQRLRTLINSNNIKDKQNYIFSLMKFNPEERRQQVLLPEMDPILDEQEKIQEEVRQIIEEDGEIEYITVLYNKSGFNLLNVKAVKMSQYAEIISIQDLSDYITIDYEDVYEKSNNEKEEIHGDLEFSIKPDILAKSENLDVKPNNEEIRKEDNNE